MRYAADLITGLGDHVKVVKPPNGADMQQIERAATKAVMESWLHEKPDVLIVGGWPFFDLAARSGTMGVPSIFIDAGAVPHDGIPTAGLPIQLELRRIRKSTLPFIDRVLPISHFIEQSQTLGDRAHSAGVRTILLGSDHLRAPYAAEETADGGASGPIVQQVRQLRRDGCKLALCLGRYEPTGYKNSPSALAVLESIRHSLPATLLLILGTQQEVDVPEHLSSFVKLLGHPTDAELREIMSEVDLGVSTSRWEGFNLPLVEMQNGGKPVLAFSLGAHPEVAADPWFLCSDEKEMCRKAVAILSGADLPRIPFRNLAAFETKLPWRQTLSAWWEEVQSAASATTERSPGRRMTLVDVTNSAADGANSGVVRVTRQLTKRLQRNPQLDVVFVRWNAGGGCYELTDPDHGFLSSYGGPVDYPAMLVDPARRGAALERIMLARHPQCVLPPIMFFPEVALDGTNMLRLEWARRRGLMCSAILHDLIPVFHKTHCSDEVIRNFPQYLAALIRSDQVIANSSESLRALRRYVQEQKSSLPANLDAIWLPAQFGMTDRVKDPGMPDQDEVRILCVSTLEPRKNHRLLLAAFAELVRRHPARRLKLILVGNRYAGADSIVADVEAAIAAGLPVHWRQVLDDAELRGEYSAARFTVYSSLVEGFGLPIVESLWLGKPCICSNEGVMAELAREGGCLTANMSDVSSLVEAMERLAFDEALHCKLADEATRRPLSSWDDYAALVGDALYGLGNPDPGPAPLQRKPAPVEEPERTKVAITLS
ncbi:hypothetical protein GCM10011611_35400 [Aliidongia dinghuensis]|uniref:Glycosyltransferase n=2 Tax=Aliidongia dinghuensis TaxID=1867774 RepID=A0A8J3E310_9PROT|nr:hypothetical protein GCM10011611_35400 [Aliidongia dinghuensis]